MSAPHVYFTVEYIPKTVIAEAKLTVWNNGRYTSSQVNIVIDQYNKKPEVIEHYATELIRSMCRELMWIDEHWLFVTVQDIVESKRQEIVSVLSENRYPF